MHEIQAQPVQRIPEALVCLLPMQESITFLYHHLHVVKYVLHIHVPVSDVSANRQHHRGASLFLVLYSDLLDAQVHKQHRKFCIDERLLLLNIHYICLLMS